MRSRQIIIFIMVAIAVMVLGAQRPMNIGHRGTGSNGAGNPYPENTIPSFEQAIAEGADMFELDVTLSADDVVVVIHDDTLDRTTDCSGCVDQWTLAEIKTCDAAEGTSLEGTGVKVPTLAEVLDQLGDQAAINIEIKTGSCGGIPTEDLVDVVDEVIQAAKVVPEILISSFSLSALIYAESLDPEYVTAYLASVGQTADGIIAAVDNNLDGVHPFHIGLTNDQITWGTSSNLLINPWTVNLPARLTELAQAGVTGIITDQPNELKSILDGLEWTDDDDDTGDDDTADDDDDTGGDDDTGDDDSGDDDDNDDDDDGCGD